MDTLDIGMQNLAVSSTPSCANDAEDDTPCKKAGSLACKGCLMVTYCSKHCQVAHWQIHRKDCKSSLMKKTWEPSWVTQRRKPAFIGSDESPHAIFGTPKYLWGNIPAIDTICLGHNEGVDFQGPINILFAASGDIRNAILSVVSLPPSYRGPLNIVVNDKEIDVVARNVIILLIFFVEKDAIAAAELVLHVWYSALVTVPCHSVLLNKVKPMVESVCDKIAQKPGSALLGKTWKFGKSSLRLVLTRDNWLSLLSYFDVPQGLDKDAAQRVRQRVMSAPERVDYVDRAMCTMSPSARLGMAKFRQDGILLPFGQPRGVFTVPNPTLFHSAVEWPMLDNADPTSGWSVRSFLEFDAGPARNDVYGKLYHFLKHLFADFHCRLRSTQITFKILHVDARLLPKSLAEEHFDRIDVSNICDMGYLGTETTLKTFSPLLQIPSVNPHATLITLFLNAIAEMRMVADSLPPLVGFPLTEDRWQQIRKVVQYMPELGRQAAQPYHANSIKMISALSLVRDMDQHFNMYKEMRGFADVAIGAGIEMKAAHTIIDPWPMAIAGGPPTAKAKEDFALLLSSGHTGQERYVEWKLTAKADVEDVN
ncbi:hypothetical protein F4779DRAFT_633541 [Xylariaceae sp. FL0662B]|nr:hypothetical protein F4779DRAFT_633541 [Xylariaceae sp. FL0662B]